MKLASESRMKLSAFFVLVLVVAVALHGSPVFASTTTSFGIRPTRAVEGQPETFSYFVFSLAPGQSSTDEALVSNTGNEPVTLRLYSANAITAKNGGTTFAPRSEGADGATFWLDVAPATFTLQPGEKRSVPFTVQVPQNASPGEHITGLVVEEVVDVASTQADRSRAQFGAVVVRRAGVAAVIDVPGIRTPALTLVGASLREQTDESGAVFEVSVRNTGNISLKGKGVLTVKDTRDTVLQTVVFEMDSILGGRDTSYYINHPVKLLDGEYRLEATAEIWAVRGPERGFATPLASTAIRVKGGQPENASALPPRGEEDRGIQILSPALDAKNSPLILLVAGVMVGLGGALILIRLRLRVR